MSEPLNQFALDLQYVIVEEEYERQLQIYKQTLQKWKERYGNTYINPQEDETSDEDEEEEEDDEEEKE